MADGRRDDPGSSSPEPSTPTRTSRLLAEDVEDEWTYVTDLEAAWRDRLTLAADGRASELATAPSSAAVDRAIDEIGRIDDPHRAIDWLSTFPQVVLVALGEPL